jgi:hypothetical protein
VAINILERATRRLIREALEQSERQALLYSLNHWDGMSYGETRNFLVYAVVCVYMTVTSSAAGERRCRHFSPNDLRPRALF